MNARWLRRLSDLSDLSDLILSICAARVAGSPVSPSNTAEQLRGLVPVLEGLLKWAAQVGMTGSLFRHQSLLTAAMRAWIMKGMSPALASMKNDLGNALAVLGKRESGTARLEEAVAAYREALQELTREREPHEPWAHPSLAARVA